MESPRNICHQAEIENPHYASNSHQPIVISQFHSNYHENIIKFNKVRSDLYIGHLGPTQ